MSTQTNRRPAPALQAMNLSHEIRDHHGATAAPRHGMMDHHNREQADREYYDDGLVHGHFWAMSSTVR